MVGAAQTISQETILAEDGRDAATPLHSKLLEKQQGGGNYDLSHEEKRGETSSGLELIYFPLSATNLTIKKIDVAIRNSF
jgi:hypothetical protein